MRALIPGIAPRWASALAVIVLCLGREAFDSLVAAAVSMSCRRHRAFSSHIALKPLAKKQLSAWRPITARLILLRKLVTEFGLEGGSGLAADAIMGFIQVRNGSAVSPFSALLVRHIGFVLCSLLLSS